jgi:hypothetical protein
VSKPKGKTGNSGAADKLAAFALWFGKTVKESLCLRKRLHSDLSWKEHQEGNESDENKNDFVGAGMLHRFAYWFLRESVDGENCRSSF